MTRPEKFEDLDENDRRGEDVVSWNQAVFEVPEIAGLVVSMIMLAKHAELEVDRFAIRVPKNEEQQGYALAHAQQRWDRGKQAYDEYEPTLEEPPYMWEANSYATTEGLPSIQTRHARFVKETQELQALRDKLTTYGVPGVEQLDDQENPELEGLEDPREAALIDTDERLPHTY